MGRYSTSPHLYDECLTLSTTKFKEWGYLEESQIRNATVSWTSRFSSSKITIRVDTFKNTVLLDYSSNGEPHKYEVKLTKMKSNLGKGYLWFFLCPVTNKRCRKLYFGNGLFLHRTVFKGMYEKQTRSKTYRSLDKYFANGIDLEKCYDELDSKYFKSHYRGKPTKRYLRLMKKIEL